MCGTRSIEVERAMVAALRILYQVYAVPADTLPPGVADRATQGSVPGRYGGMVLTGRAFISLLADAGILNDHFHPADAIAAATAGVEGRTVPCKSERPVLRRRSGRQRAPTPTTSCELEKGWPSRSPSVGTAGADAAASAAQDALVLTAGSLGPALRAVALSRFPHLDPHDARCALAARLIPLGNKNRPDVENACATIGGVAAAEAAGGPSRPRKSLAVRSNCA